MGEGKCHILLEGPWPNGDVVNDDAEVGVEPHVRGPRVRELLFRQATLCPEVTMGDVGNVLQDQEDVCHGHTCNNVGWNRRLIVAMYYR